jgi:hypothetical protein
LGGSYLAKEMVGHSFYMQYCSEDKFLHEKEKFTCSQRCGKLGSGGRCVGICAWVDSRVKGVAGGKRVSGGVVKSEREALRAKEKP